MGTFKPKLFECLKNYSGAQLIRDIISGIIVAIIALPLSIALAIASGATPVMGLYTAIVAGFVISFLGGSNVQIAGPTAAFATIVAGIINEKGFEGLALATICAGVILVIMALLRLGTLIKYIPQTITVGFTGGIAVTIFIGQIKDFLGLTFSRSPVETLEKVKEIGSSIGTLDPMALVVGILALLILVFLPKIKILSKVPPSIIAIIFCAALTKLFIPGVTTIGDLYTITSEAPKFALPAFSLSSVIDILPDAFTIAILAGVESLLSCVVADKMIGEKHNSNMELLAQGAGNICSALFGGIPATGAIARTAANIKNGGRTPVAGMVHALVLFAVLLVLMPYASLIPMSVIAAILFIVAYNMSEWREFVKIIGEKNIADILVLLVTFFLTVVFDLVVAIVAGLILHYAIVLVKKAVLKK